MTLATRATALAAVKVGAGRTEIQEFPLPVIPPDAALLRVTAAGVCGADVHAYPRPLADGPFIMGHENVGRIVQIGPVAARRWGLREGDRVALEGYQVCGHCGSCLSGYFGFCSQEGDPDDAAARAAGPLPALQPSRGGGFSQFLYMRPNTRFHHLPENVPDEQGTLAIPFGNGWQWAYFDGGAGPGKDVLILGPGQQGLGCLVAAKQAGARRVFVAGLSRDARRLAVARELGADACIDVEQEDLRQCVHDLTGGRGVDVAIDVAAGGPATVLPAIDALAPRGTLVVVPSGGLFPEFPLDRIQRKGLTLKGGYGHSFQAVELALETIASGRFPIHLVTSHRFGLKDVDLAIRATGGEATAEGVHVSVDPWS